MAKTSLILIVTFFLAQTLNSTEIYGVPKIVDGDTVHINNIKIRLEGIDAPEIKQQCKKPFLKISAIIGFEFNKNYPCGVIAKKKLIDKINNSKYKKINLTTLEDDIIEKFAFKFNPENITYVIDNYSNILNDFESKKDDIEGYKKNNFYNLNSVRNSMINFFNL